jgi:hypothetical protein
MPSDYAALSFACTIYAASSTSKIMILTNCTIPSNYMSLTTLYYLTVTAKSSANSALTTSNVIVINPAAPTIYVSGITGCNSVFSADSNFTLTAVYNTNSSNA